MAPRLHNLVRLYELAALPVDTAKIEILAEMNAFNIEGRYPESLIKTTHKGGVVDLYDSDGRSF
jgi:hypothetical protein